MYNIVVFSGGTGSIAIQEGFSYLYGNDNYNLDIIINAYDNGKSTGTCRRIFDSKILGPSDLRKNHMTQFELLYADKMKNPESREAFLFKLFTLRLDGFSKEDYYEKVCLVIEESRYEIGDEDTYYLKNLVNYFFFEDTDKKIWRSTLNNLVFKDFSLANIFYSAAAAMNGYSLRLAGKEIANVLKIKDNVHLISDVNLFLQAETESGKIISDEGEIVEWNDPEDKIVSAILLKEGIKYTPAVDEAIDVGKVKSVKSIIEAADLIIFSSGTQWSSLIPTYMHSGLYEILGHSNALKYLIVNNMEDKDMKNVSADEIIDILREYVPLDDVTAVVNYDASPLMNHVSRIKSISGHIGAGKKKHNPIKLINLIMRDFFGILDTNKIFVYDLDGTLWDERSSNHGKRVSIENINLFSGIIHSGNRYEHVRDVFKYVYCQDTETPIYTDFGNTYFTSKDYSIEIISSDYIVNQRIVEELESVDDFKNKIFVRGAGCVVTIKPLKDREILLKKVQICLKEFSGKYKAYISGNTSIDIMHKDYDKKGMLIEIMKRHNLSSDEVVFVGNETRKGSESNIKELGVQTIQVDDVYECNVLLKTLKTVR